MCIEVDYSFKKVVATYLRPLPTDLLYKSNWKVYVNLTTGCDIEVEAEIFIGIDCS